MTSFCGIHIRGKTKEVLRSRGITLKLFILCFLLSSPLCLLPTLFCQLTTRATVSLLSFLNFGKQLSALGLTDAWDQKTADFSGVSDKSQGKLHLGGVLHWSFLELAAEAGKGDVELEDEMVEKPKLFYADHPFIILVRDNTTGALLLMGALDHAEGEALHDEL
ncbi:hypothetical protein LDENG_00035100 [Lucifuga dentata]|nr:hypothetical protein LDENG_00035100 [Lucifuga dentata]